MPAHPLFLLLSLSIFKERVRECLLLTYHELDARLFDWGRKGELSLFFTLNPTFTHPVIKTGHEESDSCRLAVCTFDCVCAVVCVCVWAHVCNARNNNNNRRQAAQRVRDKVFWPDRETGRKSQSVILPSSSFFSLSRNDTADVAPSPIEITHQKQTKGLKKHKRKREKKGGCLHRKNKSHDATRHEASWGL